MDKLKISIIVPIYKVEKYIRQCVDSIISQTYEDIEIILVDDGSPDGCPAICDEYAAADSRVKVIHKKNGGLISARKAGLCAAGGEYACFVDGDDYIEPDMYEHINDAIKRDNPDAVLCEFYYSYEDRREPSRQSLERQYYTREQLEQELLPLMLSKGDYYSFGIMPCCWTKVFRRELLEKTLMCVDDRIRMGEDAAFTYPSLLMAQSVSYISKPLYNYRCISTSMSNAYDANMAQLILLPYEALGRAFDGKGFSLGEQLDMYLFYMLNILLRNESSGDNKKSFSQERRIISQIIKREDVRGSLGRISGGSLSLRKRLVLGLLKSGSACLVCIYIRLLRLASGII